MQEEYKKRRAPRRNGSKGGELIIHCVINSGSLGRGRNEKEKKRRRRRSEEEEERQDRIGNDYTRCIEHRKIEKRKRKKENAERQKQQQLEQSSKIMATLVLIQKMVDCKQKERS